MASGTSPPLIQYEQLAAVTALKRAVMQDNLMRRMVDDDGGDKGVKNKFETGQGNRWKRRNETSRGSLLVMYRVEIARPAKYTMSSGSRIPPLT